MAWGEAVLAWCHPWPCRTPLAEETGGNTKTSPRTRRVDVHPLPRSLSRQLSVGQANPLRLLLGKLRAEERTVPPAVLENRRRLVLPQNQTHRQPLETWTWRKARHRRHLPGMDVAGACRAPKSCRFAALHEATASTQLLLPFPGPLGCAHTPQPHTPQSNPTPFQSKAGAFFSATTPQPSGRGYFPPSISIFTHAHARLSLARCLISV